jgi:hypothetical protein
VSLVREARADTVAAAAQAERRIALTFSLVIALLLLAAVAAALVWRGLFQDGTYYLFRMAEREGFYLVDPARTTVQVLRQAPVVLAIRLGQASLPALGALFSLAMLALPTLITALCWFIVPREDRAYALFPLAHLLLGDSAASLEAVGEAAIAVAYLWVLLFLLLFRTRRIVSQMIFLALCIPAFGLHEGAFLLMPVLLAACGMRLVAATRRGERAFVAIAALLVVATMAYELRWVLWPRIPGEREDALHGLVSLGFLVSEGRINIAAVTACAGALALGAIVLARGDARDGETRRPRRIAAALVLVVLAISPLPWLVENCVAPHAQTLARYAPVFASLVLAAVMLFAYARRLPPRRWASPAVLVVLLAVAAGQVSADLAVTMRWRAYMADLSTRLTTATGLVPWASTLATGDARRDANWRALSVGWVMPLLSIVFAPEGRVCAIIDYPPGAWRPIEPSRPDTLPRLRGVDDGCYRRTLQAGGVKTE